MAFNVLDMFEAKKKEAEREQKYLTISVHKLVPDKDNFYSTDGIKELAASIDMFGMLQPIVVVPIEGTDTYKIKAGHRRRLAVLQLLAEGKNEAEMVDCTIKPPMVPALEKLMLITTNATTRVLTSYEQMEQAQQARAALLELKAQGESLPGRIRDHIAAMLAVSPATVARMDAINNNLAPELKEKFKAGQINAATAYELSGATKEAQAAANKRLEEGEALQKDTAHEIKAESKPVPPPPAPARTPLENVPLEPYIMSPAGQFVERAMGVYGPATGEKAQRFAEAVVRLSLVAGPEATSARTAKAIITYAQQNSEDAIETAWSLYERVCAGANLEREIVELLKNVQIEQPQTEAEAEAPEQAEKTTKDEPITPDSEGADIASDKALTELAAIVGEKALEDGTIAAFVEAETRSGRAAVYFVQDSIEAIKNGSTLEAELAALAEKYPARPADDVPTPAEVAADLMQIAKIIDNGENIAAIPDFWTKTATACRWAAQFLRGK